MANNKTTRKTVARRIACDEREMESINQIIRRGVHVYFQTVPRKDWEEAKKYLPE